MRRQPMQSYQQAARVGEELQRDESVQEQEETTDQSQSEENHEIESPASATVEAEIESRYKAELDDMRLRAAAEMENFKKRLAREHQEQIRYAAEKVLGDILPALDNLELALQYGKQNEACKDMLQGIAMTHKLLLEAVSRHGLTPVGDAGEGFNPEIHEAVGCAVCEDLPNGAISQVLQRGYKLGDRLIRPAKVMVNQ